MSKSNRISRSSFIAIGAAAALFGGMIAAGTHPGALPQEETKPDPVAGAWNVDTVHSCALFRVRHMGAGFFWGRFNDVSGSIRFDPTAPDDLGMDISIDVGSVDSGHPGLDKHLKSPDFFDAKEFPAIVFTSESAVLKPTNKRSDSPVHAWDVTGKLSMSGVTKEVTAEVVYWGAADLGRGTRAGFETTFTITRSEFGVDYGVDQGSLGDRVNVTAAFEVIK